MASQLAAIVPLILKQELDNKAYTSLHYRGTHSATFCVALTSINFLTIFKPPTYHHKTMETMASQLLQLFH